ncbi:hypothetical protein K7X08_032202 [Anisodus acutangulus]|uniref:Pentatricopeptide repeat-containing protein n=1 Tax=Anisodus acutangulus TaxID=402998 RepID=A0A9Q1MDV0_9SOLA|nr:hypothetical protein K7X08_032202 [Anisodus acutangulus]
MLVPSIRLFLKNNPTDNPYYVLKMVHLSTTSSSSTKEFLNHLLNNKNGYAMERTLNAVRAKLDARCVDEVLEKCAVNDPQTGLRFFIWAGLNPSYRHSSYMFSRAYKLLEVDRKPQIIRDVLEAYRLQNYVPSAKMFKVILNMCREGKDANMGLWVLRKMKGCNCRPDTTVYNVVIQLLREKGDMDEAMGLMREMELIDLHPDMITYVVIIKGLSEGLCKDGHVEEAHKVINRVAESGIPLDSCYSFLVLSLLRIGKLKEAEMFFRRMLTGGLKPDGLTSSTIIRWLCQKSRILDGYHLIDVIEQSPSVSSIDSDIYSILMAGLCEEKHLVEAAKLANLMVEKGVKLKGPYVKNVIECLRHCCGKEDLASSIANIKS